MEIRVGTESSHTSSKKTSKLSDVYFEIQNALSEHIMYQSYAPSGTIELVSRELDVNKNHVLRVALNDGIISKYSRNTIKFIEFFDKLTPRPTTVTKLMIVNWCKKFNIIDSTCKSVILRAAPTTEFVKYDKHEFNYITSLVDRFPHSKPEQCIFQIRLEDPNLDAVNKGILYEIIRIHRDTPIRERTYVLSATTCVCKQDISFKKEYVFNK